MPDATTLSPSIENAIHLIPLTNGDLYLVMHSIVLVFQIQIHGFGPTYPVAQYCPDTSDAKQRISSSWSNMNCYVLSLWLKTTPTPAA